MLIAIYVGLVMILFLMGFAVPYALGISAVVGMIYSGSFGFVQMQTMVTKMATGVNSFTLLAIPLFLLSGKLMNVGSITERIFKFCNALVGWIPGGLGQVNILASVVFAGMSGSAVADAAGLGTIEIRAMRNEGFDAPFSAGQLHHWPDYSAEHPANRVWLRWLCVYLQAVGGRHYSGHRLRNLPGNYGRHYLKPPSLPSQRISHGFRAI